jgi:gamma-butyrobetaine dioxygenase
MSAEAVELRRWDDAAKDPNGPVLDMSELLAAHDRRTAAHSTAGTSPGRMS